MRVVIDTNIIVSALIAPAGKPATIINVWLDGKFMLLTCAAHVDELRSTLQKPRVAELVKPHKAGRLVNQIKRFADDVGVLPRVERSPGRDRRFSTGPVRSGQGRLSRDGRQERPSCPGPPQSHAHRVRARILRTVRMNQFA
ncbi:MAG: PIN domain-containing protein [Acidobacteriota bacterium]|nr:PIN domain-containing protein [Acidobacteriota bacterium]